MANETEMRQGLNGITVVGEVKEQKLNEGTGDNGKYINGSLVIKTGEFSEIEVKLFTGEKTKDGSKTKKIFETLKGFIDGEYITLADCKTNEDRENVTKVRIYGNKDFTPHFREEIFKIKETGEVKTKNSIDLGFGNISIDSSIKPEDYKATFDIEMYVSNVIEEEKNEESTGRAIVKGWIPVYGGKVIPAQVVCGTLIDDDGSEIDFGSEVLDAIEEGMTVNFWGNIDYRAIITKTTKGGSLGKKKVEEKRDYINELVVEGAEPVEDEEKEFDPELIKKAKIERDTEIENKKNEEVKEEKKGKGLSKSNKTKRERPSF